MTVSKAPKALILLVILALAGALAVAGCGGGGSTTSETTAEESPPAEEEAEGGGEAAAGGEGKTIFSANCASCHTLKAAGASGEVGPDLDELEPSEERVETQVINGGGPMPAFGKQEILTPEEITTVSEYVAAEAGK
jgi:mono/diheme cytochrome c family protein